MATNTITGRVRSMKRLTNTPAGGPRYEIDIVTSEEPERGIAYTSAFRTAGNVSDSYAWDPHRFEGRMVTLTINGRGTVDVIEVR